MSNDNIFEFLLFETSTDAKLVKLQSFAGRKLEKIISKVLRYFLSLFFHSILHYSMATTEVVKFVKKWNKKHWNKLENWISELNKLFPFFHPFMLVIVRNEEFLNIFWFHFLLHFFRPLSVLPVPLLRRVKNWANSFAKPIARFPMNIPAGNFRLSLRRSVCSHFEATNFERKETFN